MPLPTTDDLTFIEVSLCKFSDADIRGIAAHVVVPEERVRAFLADQSDRDSAIYHACWFIARMYPIRSFRGMPPKLVRPTAWERIMAD